MVGDRAAVVQFDLFVAEGGVVCADIDALGVLHRDGQVESVVTAIGQRAIGVTAAVGLIDLDGRRGRGIACLLRHHDGSGLSVAAPHRDGLAAGRRAVVFARRNIDGVAALADRQPLLAGGSLVLRGIGHGVAARAADRHRAAAPVVGHGQAALAEGQSAPARLHQPDTDVPPVGFAIAVVGRNRHLEVVIALHLAGGQGELALACRVGRDRTIGKHSAPVALIIIIEIGLFVQADALVVVRSGGGLGRPLDGQRTARQIVVHDFHVVHRLAVAIQIGRFDDQVGIRQLHAEVAPPLIAVGIVHGHGNFEVVILLHVRGGHGELAAGCAAETARDVLLVEHSATAGLIGVIEVRYFIQANALVVVLLRVGLLVPLDDQRTLRNVIFNDLPRGDLLAITVDRRDGDLRDRAGHADENKYQTNQKNQVFPHGERTSLCPIIPPNVIAVNVAKAWQ